MAHLAPEVCLELLRVRSHSVKHQFVIHPHRPGLPLQSLPQNLKLLQTRITIRLHRHIPLPSIVVEDRICRMGRVQEEAEMIVDVPEEGWRIFSRAEGYDRRASRVLGRLLQYEP